MKPVFLDTTGLIALWDEADQWHAAAMPIFVKLLAARTAMVTTPMVLLECGNAASRRTYRADVFDLCQTLLARNRLFEPTMEEIEQAWKDYRAGLAGDAGIVDHISFLVMRRLAITQAFTHNGHFSAAGFEALF